MNGNEKKNTMTSEEKDLLIRIITKSSDILRRLFPLLEQRIVPVADFFRVNHFFYVIAQPLTQRHSTLTVA